MSVKCRLGGGLYGPPTGIINLMCAVCALSHFLSLRMFGQSARAELATGGICSHHPVRNAFCLWLRSLFLSVFDPLP